MKKLIPLFTILFATLMLSGCVIFWPDDYNSTRRYSVTCHNESGHYITDWCVVKNGQVTYARSETNHCPITAGDTSTLSNLPYGSYVLYVSFKNNPNYRNGDYVETRPFTLSQNANIYIDVSYYPNN